MVFQERFVPTMPLPTCQQSELCKFRKPTSFTGTVSSAAPAGALYLQEICNHSENDPPDRSGRAATTRPPGICYRRRRIRGRRRIAGTAGVLQQIPVSIVHPFAAGANTDAGTLSVTAGWGSSVGVGNTYAVIAGLGYTGRGMIEFHRKALAANRQAGNAEGSEPVLGESLNLMGLAGTAQLSRIAEVSDQIAGSTIYDVNAANLTSVQAKPTGYITQNLKGVVADTAVTPDSFNPAAQDTLLDGKRPDLDPVNKSVDGRCGEAPLDRGRGACYVIPSASGRRGPS
jgi:hypothetical protein